MINNYKLNITCPCKNKESKIFFTFKKKPKLETDFKINKSEYFRHYKICLNCSHMFGEHNIDLRNLYDSDYLNSTYNGISGMKKRFNFIMNLPFKKSDNKQRVKRILDFMKINSKSKSKNLLDVGSGTGVFAKSLMNKKWQVHALEPDKRTVEYLNKLGIKSFHQDIRKFKINKKYSLITFNKVLEHVERPIQLLNSCKKFMNKDSYLYIEVPDIIASSIGKEREEFFIDHHHVFSITSATLLIEKAGLVVRKVERILEPSGKFTIYLFATN